MPNAYVICDIDVTDPVAYDDYKKLAGPSVDHHGGRYIVRGGATEVLEGDRQPNRVVVIEFPSPDAAKRWYGSEDYGEARRVRANAATTSIIVVEGAP
jgi:uncharacterized protein (DUF1330 family)